MAERRMMTRKVTDDDRFINLSSSAQALYLHLSMCADDDGFCNQVSVSMFRAHASMTDLQALLENRFLLQFDTGVIVIKHWRMANSLRKDRYTPTAFQDELAQLYVKENGAYTFDNRGLPVGCHAVANGLPDGCQTVANGLPDGNHSIDKSRLDKNRIKESKEKSVDDATQTPRRAQKKSHIDVNLSYLSTLDHGEHESLEPIIGKLTEWLTYKGESKFSYTAQGFKTLIRQIIKYGNESGFDAVSSLIDESIGNGWKGIIWERLNKPQKSSPKPMTRFHNMEQRQNDPDEYTVAMMRNLINSVGVDE